MGAKVAVITLVLVVAIILAGVYLVVLVPADAEVEPASLGSDEAAQPAAQSPERAFSMAPANAPFAVGHDALADPAFDA